MDFICENRKTPILERYDVIVVGGGPAGAVAAISAARHGAKTLLIERFNCLGGMWTVGFMNPLFDSEGKGGILREIIDTLKARGAWGGFRNISFRYEEMKVLLDELCRDAGVHLLLSTDYSDVVREGNRVCGVIAENVGGRAAYTAGCIIDASGDARVAADAGAEIAVGDEAGRTQAMTLMFLVGGVPDSLSEGEMLYKRVAPYYAKEGIEMPFTFPYLIPAPGVHYAVIQYTHMHGVHPLSAEERSFACVEGRRQMMEMMRLLHENDPALRHLELIGSAPVLGVRESRRIVGEYTLCAEDLFAGRKFADGFTSSRFNIDIHSPDTNGQKCRPVGVYEIPYRCLIPKGVEGLLVAGRTISGTHEAMASYRVTGTCAAMGEAAGTAAAYVAAHACGVRDVDIRRIQPFI